MTDDRESADRTPESRSSREELPVGAPVRVSKLADLKCVRAEAGRLYREARRREGRYPDALTAQRLGNVLGNVRAMIEFDELARRVDALEQREEERRGA